MSNNEQQPDINNLQETFNKQQAKINALKELVRKSESAQGKSNVSAQLMAKNIAEKLTDLKTKARSRQNLHKSFTDLHQDAPDNPCPVVSISTPTTTNVRKDCTPGSEKIQLLRKQMEVNRIKMAERKNSKREIEEMVTQLKANFDSAQQSLEHSTELGRSMGDLSSLSYTPIRDKMKSATDLSFAPLNLDKERIKFLENRVRLLEKQLEKGSPDQIKGFEETIFQLTESLEKAKAQAVTTIVDDELEEHLRQKVQDLEDKIKDQDLEIKELKDVNDVLETIRCDLKVQNSKMEEKISVFESQKFEIITKEDVETSDEFVSQIRSFEEKIQALEKENDELKKVSQDSQDLSLVSDENAADVIKSMESTLDAQKEKLQLHADKIAQLEEQLAEKTVECNVLNANLSVLEENLKQSIPKSLFTTTTDEEADAEIIKLKGQLDEVNKSMIKMKLKSKQLQKQVDSFKKISNANEEVVKLKEENEKLEERIAELSQTKSSSSAESIEIVERFTPQECLEIEAFNKGLELPKTIQESNEMGEELSDSLIKLREESSELMNKIELFTVERREVLEKMEKLTNENQENLENIETLLTEKNELSIKYSDSAERCSELEKLVERLTNEKESAVLNSKKINDELNSLKKQELALMPSTDLNNIIEKCEKTLNKLNNELETFKKATDKSSKLHCSKKLAKEAKNSHQVFVEILDNVKMSIEKSMPEVENYKKEIAQLEEAKDEYSRKIEELKKSSLIEISELKSDIEELQKNNADVEPYEKKIFELTEVISELKKAQDEKCSDETQIVELNREILKLKANYEEKLDELQRITKEQAEFQTQIASLEKLLNEKNSSLETLSLRQQTSDKEMEILKTLIAEQKEQLIESYKEREEEMSSKLEEIASLKQHSSTESLHFEIKNLKEALNMSKSMAAENDAELANKQATIEMLNAQIMELYKTMEENSNKIIEKDDELAYLQEILDSNKSEMDKISKENQENKKVVEKLLMELHSQKDGLADLERLQAVENEKRMFEEKTRQLEVKNKEQLEKMKKFAANLKKKSAQCAELEEKIKRSGEGVGDSNKLTELEETVKLKTKECAELESRIIYLEELAANGASNDLEIKLTQLTNQLNILSKEHNELKMSYEEKSVNCHELAKQLERLSTVEHECNQLRQKLAEQAELKKKVKKLSKLENECIQLREKISQFENMQELIEVKTKNVNLFATQHANISQQADFMNELSLAKERNLQQKLACEQLNAEIESLRKAKISSEELVTRLSNGLDGLRSQIDVCTGELHEKDSKIAQLSLKVEKCKAVIKDKNIQIQRLNKEKGETDSGLVEKNKKLEEEITTIREATNIHIAEGIKTYKKMEEQKLVFQEAILKMQMLYDGVNAKLQEDLSYIESLETENAKYKNKICKLEECIATFEDRRSSMERRANLLDTQLQSKTDEFQKSEDELIYRLNMLSDHDDIIGQRLLECQEEKETMADKVDKLKEEYADLTLKYSKLEKDYKILESDRNDSLETENQSLREQLSTVESDINKIHSNYKTKLDNSRSEMDELENELGEQVKSIEDEKRSIKEQLERSTDEVADLKDEIVRMKESISSLEQIKGELEREITWTRMQSENMSQDQYEIQELRMQVMHDKTEIEHLKHQIESLVQNHDIELNALRLQITELDHLRMQVGQNQTDDQQFIVSENKRLKDVLKERDIAIENYQRQNLQLQMNSFMMGSSAQQSLIGADPFASLASTSQPDDSMELDSLREKVGRLEEQNHHLEGQLASAQPDNSLEISALQKTIEHLENQIKSMEVKSMEYSALTDNFNSIQSEIDLLRVANNELRAECEKKVDLCSKLEESANVSAVELENSREQLRKASEEIGALKLICEGFDSEKRENLANKDILENELMKQKELCAKFEEEIKKLQNSCGILKSGQNEIDSILEKNKSLEGELTKLNMENFDMSEKLKMFEAQVFNFEEKIREAFGVTQDVQKMYEEKLQQKTDEYERVFKELNSLREEFNQLLMGNSETQHQNVQCQKEIDFLSKQLEDVKKSQAPNPIASVFQQDGNGSVSVFDEFFQPKQVSTVSADIPQIAADNKIVDQLKSKISNLEKELMSVSALYQDTIRQLNETERMYENLLKESGDKIKALEYEKNLENLIIPNEPLPKISSGLSSFFTQETPTNVPEFPSQDFTEPEIVSKKSYVCGTEGQSQDVVPEALSLDLGDDWGGWAAEEKPFEKVTAIPSLLSPSSHLNIQLQDANDRIRELELENKRIEEQKQELHVKSGKLMKKLKEYKTKLDSVNVQSFRKSASIESNELDIAIQEELKSQVRKLEEQLLEFKKSVEKDSNEKESLTKRVDVLTSANDRMIEMKERQDMEVQMYKSKICDLNEKLNKVGDWGEENEEAKVGSNNIVTSIEDTGKLKELELKIHDLTCDRDELQALLDEEKSNNRQAEERVKLLQDRISKLEENNTTEASELRNESNEMKLNNQTLNNSVNELEESLNQLRISKSQTETKLEEKCKEVESLKLKNNLEWTVLEKESVIDDLKKEILELQNSNLNSEQLTVQLKNKEAEIIQLHQMMEEIKKKASEAENLKEIISELKIKLESSSSLATNENAPNDLLVKLHDKEAQVLHLTSELNHIRNLLHNNDFEEKLQEKEVQISHLMHRIEELQHEDQTEKLVLEILTKNQEIHMLKMKTKHLEEEKSELKHSLTHEAIPQEHTDYTDNHEKIRQLEILNAELSDEKAHMEEELKVLNDHVLASIDIEDKMKAMSLEMERKNIEIHELKAKILMQPEQGVNPDLEKINAHWELKCGEIANSWRQHLEQREQEMKAELERLNLEITSMRSSSEMSGNVTTDPSNLQAALEAQELEIVTLKEQLAIRSAEYASLAARYDPYQMKTNSSDPRRTASTGETSVVNKSELDLALYMLHQRDMRCEELTLELVSLLEERDTLQLKLSNTIRQVEEIRNRVGLGDAQMGLEGGSTSNVPETHNPEDVKQQQSVELSPSKKDDLREKIFQLQTMGYSKDKNFREERDERIRQMERIQQDVANIPSQAVSELVGTDFSQTSQSPSSVLLNWLWGKPSGSQHREQS